MPPSLPLPEEDAYNSASDSDFDASLSPSSGDESEVGTGAMPKKGRSGKRKVDADGDLRMGSGDEGVVAQGRKKRRKTKGKGKSKAGPDDVDEDEEEEQAEEVGVGIRVRLRSGRGGEEKKKQAPKTSSATVDIDSIWASMNSPAASTRPALSTPPDPNAMRPIPSTEPQPPSAPPPSTTMETILIPHKYTFAGETHTSTKRVSATSPEALAYLANPISQQKTSIHPSLRRPLARKNLLDPNPTALINSRQLPPRSDLPPSIGGNGAKALAANARVSEWANGVKGKAKKLNTVEKSKFDWEKEVERLGIAEELEKAEKSGENYLGRMDFLGRVEGGREEEARRMRMMEKA